MADVEFFFDPVCPFCWVTSEWMRTVQERRGLDIDWRFISLAMLNEGQYEGRAPEYPPSHHRGLEMLRVAAAARASHGPGVVGNLYQAMGTAIWHADPAAIAAFDNTLAYTAQAGDLPAILSTAGLPADLAEAAEDATWDKEIRADTDTALARAGADVGTPILSFDPPDGPAFFGPVISSVPAAEDAERLYDTVRTLATWPDFAELKRSLRESPRTPVGVAFARRAETSG